MSSSLIPVSHLNVPFARSNHAHTHSLTPSLTHSHTHTHAYTYAHTHTFPALNFFPLFCCASNGLFRVWCSSSAPQTALPAFPSSRSCQTLSNTSVIKVRLRACVCLRVCACVCVLAYVRVSHLHFSIAAVVVTKDIFPPVSNGFNDTVPAVREEASARLLSLSFDLFLHLSRPLSPPRPLSTSLFLSRSSVWLPLVFQTNTQRLHPTIRHAWPMTVDGQGDAAAGAKALLVPS